MVVLSPQTINSSWLRREIRQALAIQQQRQAEGYRVIPLLLPGMNRPRWNIGSKKNRWPYRSL